MVLSGPSSISRPTSRSRAGARTTGAKSACMRRPWHPPPENVRAACSCRYDAAMTELADIPSTGGFALFHLFQFRNRRLEWQMKLMHELGDICRTWLGPVPALLVSSAEDAEAILLDQAD